MGSMARGAVLGGKGGVEGTPLQVLPFGLMAGEAEFPARRGQNKCVRGSMRAMARGTFLRDGLVDDLGLDSPADLLVAGDAEGLLLGE